MAASFKMQYFCCLVPDQAVLKLSAVDLLFLMSLCKVNCAVWCCCLATVILVQGHYYGPNNIALNVRKCCDFIVALRIELYCVALLSCK